VTAGRGTGVRLIAAAAVVAALVVLVWWLDDEPSLQGEPVGRGVVSESVDGPMPEPTTRPLEADVPAPDAGEVVPLVADELQPDAPPLPTEVRPESAMVVITGRVVDAYEAPVQGAELRFGLHGNDRNLQQAAWSDPIRASYRMPATQPVFSDADGRFTIHVDAAHARTQTRSFGWVVALAEGCAALPHRTPPLTEDAVDLGDLQVAPGLSLQARVVDGDGRALPEVDVQFLSLQPTRAEDVRSGVRRSPQEDDQRFDEVLRAVLQGVTDERGLLRIDHVPDGNARLHLEREDLVPLTLPFAPLIVPGPADLGDVVMDAGGTFAGTVVFADGRPAIGAQVGVVLRDDGSGRDAHTLDEDRRLGRIAELPPGRMTSATVTDERGRFALSGLADGLYEVSAAADGHPWTHVTAVPVGRPDLEIALAPSGTLQLDVSDALTGVPVDEPEVTVTVPANYAHLRSGHSWHHDVRVDPEVPGLVTITGIGLEGASLTVSAADYGPTDLDEGPVPPGSLVTREVPLDPALHLSGVVLDELRAPLPGVRVEVTALPGRESWQTESDEQGTFRIDGLRAGPHVISARAPGVLESLRTDLELVGSWERYVIRLDREAFLTGTVLDRHGEPVPGAVVLAWPLWDTPGGVRREPEAGVDLLSHVWAPVPTTTADERGRYRLGRMVPGSYAAFATMNGELHDDLAHLRWNGHRFDVPDHAERAVALGGREVARDLGLPVTTGLHGAVRVGGAPTVAGTIELFVAAEGWPPWRRVGSARCDAQGAYELLDLEPGPCVVVAQGGYGVFPMARRLELAPEQLHRHDVDLGATRIVGTVTEQGTGRGAPGVTVRVTPDFREGTPWIEATGLTYDDLTGLPGEPSVAVAVTDESGAFGVQGLPAGFVAAMAYGDEYLASMGPWVTLRDDQVLELSLEVVRGARIEGTLAFRDGTPVDISSLLITLWEPVEERELGFSHVADGRWSFAGLEAGHYELRVVEWEDETIERLRTSVSVSLGRTEHVDLLLDD
jgi:hypothetical protein